MKALNLKVMAAGLMMMSAACNKLTMSKVADDGAIQTLSCKGETAPVDPSALKIEGTTVAQAGRATSFNLNYDLSCSSSQKVSWQTSEGQILSQSNKGMISTFAAPGRFVVSASVQSSGAAFAAKADTSISQKTTVVGSQPMISGPQVAIVGNSYNYDLALPEGYVLASASWNFGDSSAPMSGTGSVAHKWNVPGLYQVQATVMNMGGASSVVSYSVNVVDFYDGAECVVDTMINAPVEGHVGQPVDLSVFIPNCLKNAVTSVSWNYGDSSARGSGASVQHTFQNVGDYTVTVNVYAPYVPAGTPFLTLTQTIHVTEAPPAPTPTPSPTPVVNPGACDPDAIRQTTSDPFSRQVACGVDGTKKQVFQTRVIEACKLTGGALAWSEVSRTDVMVSEGACEGQSCSLPDGSKLANGQSRVLYSSSMPAGSCASVSQTRVCNNGSLGGSMSFMQLSCRSGCGDFGVDGTVKNGVTVGETKVPLACKFGEEGYFSLFNQIADQKCSDGQIQTSNSRQGSIKMAGACPTYAWVATDNWTQCSANCGGKQNLIYECRNDQGQSAPSERCSGAAPVQTRDCDGNPDAVKRVDVSTSQENAGSTKMCPADQIGVVVSERTVTETKTYACSNHSVQLVSDVKANGAWATESYCRDYVAHRCSQDSLSIQDAQGRYQWMKSCQDKVPAIKEFLTQFKDVKVSGGYSIDSNVRPLYPTFMDNATNPEVPWIAPSNPSASCDVPKSAYVAAVCLSSCATPDQEILVQAQANLKLKYMPFIDALTQKSSSVATLASNGSISSKTVVKTKVDQWVTELIDTEHDIIEFRMKSGRVLKLTPNHPVLTAEGKMKSAGEFQIGESLVMLGGALDPIESMDHVKYFGKVYNLFVQSNDLQKNVVITNGYLNGTAYFQNEGVSHMNRAIFRDNLTRGALNK